MSDNSYAVALVTAFLRDAVPGFRGSSHAGMDWYAAEFQKVLDSLGDDNRPADPLLFLWALARIWSDFRSTFFEDRPPACLDCVVPIGREYWSTPAALAQTIADAADEILDGALAAGSQTRDDELLGALASSRLPVASLKVLLQTQIQSEYCVIDAAKQHFGDLTPRHQCVLFAIDDVCAAVAASAAPPAVVRGVTCLVARRLVWATRVSSAPPRPANRDAPGKRR